MKISKARFNELGLGCDTETKNDRLKSEMTDAEYDAYQHNRLEIE